MADSVWAGGEQFTVPQLFGSRLESDPDGEYLDVVGTSLSAAEVMAAADRIGGALHALGTDQRDRVATLIENSSPALLTWVGTVCAGRVAVPVNTAYKGEYLTHQLTDSGSRVVVVAAALRPDDRDGRSVPDLEHVVVVDDADAGGDEEAPARAGPERRCLPSAGRGPPLGRVVAGAPQRRPSRSSRPTSGRSSTRAGRPACRRAACSATATTRRCPSRSRCAGAARPTTSCGRRCRSTTSTRWSTGGGGHARGRRARRHLQAVLGLTVLAGDEPGRRDHHVDARDHGLPARPRHRPSRDAALGPPAANRTLAAHRGGAAAARGRLGAEGALRHRHLLRRLRGHRGQPRLVAAAGGGEPAQRRRRGERRVLRRADLRRRRPRGARPEPTARSCCGRSGPT